MLSVVWKHRVARLIALLQRYPGVVAAFGFVSGVCSFMLVDRQARLSGVLAVVLLISWLWLLGEGLVNRVFARLVGRPIPKPLLQYATQMIHQESLFFVLPFFFVTTTWNSGQALFTGLLGLCGLASIVDPLYFKGIATRRVLYLGLHTLALFAVLLTALPILLHLTTAESYQLALGATVLMAFPSLLVTFPVQRWWRGLALIGLTLALAGAGWLLRYWIPPATLWLTEVAVTSQFDNQNRAPGKSLTVISASQLRSEGLYAYTAINAPRGLDERIYHEWQRNGGQVERIALDIHGGRKAGYRAWTHKRNFPAEVVGDWQVRVVTDNDQLIGVLRFTVVDGPVSKASEKPADATGIKPDPVLPEPAEDTAPEETPAPAESAPEAKEPAPAERNDASDAPSQP